jgi:anti-sigma factor RsiW
MNCRDIEPLLMAERDGVLSSEMHAVLDEHVAGCPACRRSRAAYGEAVTFLKTDAANVRVPDANEEWRTIRAKLNAETGKSEKKRPLAPVIWFAAPLAAAAALAVVFFGHHAAEPSAEKMMARSPVTAGGSNAPTIAYVDKDSGWLVVWAPDGDAKKSG